ncbi:glycosyltransferase family 2 protein [Paenibacillus sp. BC26]|uniref:glycosyltransferase family 2 protein n=1 Tax=Paenibacillus sp. BC26 TaxID=1881032 RepID=UPI0008EBA48F|nr:glycosyltransferase family 2 protein [Paenibacillus sp. BC26]SFT20738.1 Glycosyltransferase involved in cell wall bisynthesis [Paenibacillus sp. BC26]
MKDIEISVVIPVYNEAVHIAGSLRTVAEQLQKTTSSFEIIVIDDGSRDETWSRLSSLGQQLPELYSYRLSRNFGKEYALCAGLDQARGRAVIIMDSDMQHPPSLLSQMIHLWRNEGKQIVECVKVNRGKERFDKALGASLFYSLLNRLSGMDLRGASDFKLLDRRIVDAWKLMPERNMFFRGMTAWVGFERAQIPFEVPERVGGDSQWSLFSLIKLAVQAIVAFSSIPLRVVNLFGVIFLVGSALLGIQTLVRYFMGTAVSGFTTVILLLLFTGSLILISLGIIGEYMASIYMEVKGRPRYFIRESAYGAASKETLDYRAEAAASIEET